MLDLKRYLIMYSLAWMVAEQEGYTAHFYELLDKAYKYYEGIPQCWRTAMIYVWSPAEQQEFGNSLKYNPRLFEGEF